MPDQPPSTSPVASAFQIDLAQWRRDNRRLLWALILIPAVAYGLYLLVLQVRTGALSGFPLDDAWIYQVYARNLVARRQWQFIPGVPSAGSTSTLFTFFLSTGHAIRNYQYWTHAIGLFGLFFVTLRSGYIARLVFTGVPGIGLWTIAVIVLAWHHVWAAASGMETVFFSWMCMSVIAWTIAISAHNRISVRQQLLWGLTFGVSCGVTVMLRLEGAMLIGMCAAVLAVVFMINRRFNLFLWVSTAVSAGIVVLLASQNNLALTGSLLPNTAAAKQTEFASLLERGLLVNLWAMLNPLLASALIVLIPFIGYSVWLLGVRRARGRIGVVALILLIGWPIALLILYAVRLPANYQHGRYVIPALAPLLTLGTGGLIHFTARKTYDSVTNTYRYLQKARLTPVAVGLRGALILLTLALFVQGAFVYADDVQAINSDAVQAAQWIRRNIPRDQLIAAHDIGALGYFAPRPFIDLAGLVTPETIPYLNDPDGMWTLMEARGVRYLMLTPYQVGIGWMDRLCERYNAGGGLGGMRVYEVRQAEPCE